MPVGTVVINVDTDEVIGDLTEHGAAPAGRAGRPGRPRQHAFQELDQSLAARGDAGHAKARSAQLKLELKLLADVGLLGFPERGQIDVHPRGVGGDAEGRRLSVHHAASATSAWSASSTDRSFVIADIPGLIEGAAEGAGLGILFLRHVQRTRLLLHLVDIAPMDGGIESPAEQVRAIENELRKVRPRNAGKAALAGAQQGRPAVRGRGARSAPSEVVRRTGLDAAVVPGLRDRPRRHVADHAGGAGRSSIACARTPPNWRMRRAPDGAVASPVQVSDGDDAA